MQSFDLAFLVGFEQPRCDAQDHQGPKPFQGGASQAIGPRELCDLRDFRELRQPGSANRLHRSQEREKRQQDDREIDPVLADVVDLFLGDGNHQDEFSRESEPDHAGADVQCDSQPLMLSDLFFEKEFCDQHGQDQQRDANHGNAEVLS